MKFVGTCYRTHDPKWSFKPISGDGAAIHGGRFNAKGTPALYLALTLVGAFREANQGFARKIDPYVVCSYDVDCEDIADLTTAASLAMHKVEPSDLACAWMTIATVGNDPPSWQVSRRLHRQGFAGALVPSFARGAQVDEHNLVLWKWAKDRPHKVSVYDPSDRLPKNQLSWD